MIEELSPSEWLNRERKARGFAGAAPIDEKRIESIVSKLPAGDQEAARKVWVSRIGKTVGEIHDEQMQQYRNRFELALPDQERKLVEECYFGILPTQEFNAYAGRTPCGDRIVILHEALTHIIAIWCHWYTRSSEEGRNTLNTEERRHKMLTYFVETWYGNPAALELPDIYPLSCEQWRYSESLAIACMNFVMGHEIGHLLHQHGGYSIDRKKNYAMEFQADEKGVEICIRMFLLLAANKMSDYADTYILAPFMSIGVISLFGDSSNNTHPSATMRKDNIKIKIDEMLQKGKRKGFDENMLMLYGEVESMFLILSEYRDEVRHLMRRHKKPDNMWLRSLLESR